jgi:hypothetical protein
MTAFRGKCCTASPSRSYCHFPTRKKHGPSRGSFENDVSGSLGYARWRVDMIVSSSEDGEDGPKSDADDDDEDAGRNQPDWDEVWGASDVTAAAVEVWWWPW